MEKMILFCMLFFWSSMVLTAAPPKAVKYKQLAKTIDQLKGVVKDKDVELLHTPDNPGDGCLFTAVTCFQNGTLKLQPKNSQVNATFTKTIKILRKPILPGPGEHCESSCESFERKKPQEFLNSFSKLMQKLYKDAGHTRAEGY